MSGDKRQISEEIKNFYSAGTTFSIVGCAGSVQIVWAVMGRLWPYMKAEWIGMLISVLIILAYALVIPEPEGWPNAGRLKLTMAELIFGVLNSFIVFAIVLGLNAALAP
jgi:hypothetical protein